MANPARLRSLVRRLRGRRLGVVGDLILDRFLRGSVRRISPEAPVPVVEVNQPETVHLGGAANVAANLAALGARAAVFGVSGADPAGHELRRELARGRIELRGLLADPQRRTSEKIRVIGDHQHLLRFDREDSSPISPAMERRLLTALRRALPRLDGLVLSDYDKGVLTETLLAELLPACAARRVPVFVDLKKPRRLEPGVALVLVNQRRAEEIAGRALRDEKSLELVGRHLLARFPAATLVITRGAGGMAVLEKSIAGTDALRIAAVRTRPWEVFDVTGAGDTVMATLALALTVGASPQEAAALANAAAGIVVGKLGTAVCTPAELLAGLARDRRS